MIAGAWQVAFKSEVLTTDVIDSGLVDVRGGEIC